MKKTILITATVLIALTACSTTQKPKKAKQLDIPKTEIDSVSYAMGIVLGYNVRGVANEIGSYNLDQIKKGMKEIINIESDEEATAMIQKYDKAVYDFMTQELPKYKAEYATKELAKIKKANPAIQETESGLMYEIIEPGDTTKTVANNEEIVSVHYVGTLLNGEEFDSSRKYSEDPIELSLGSVIAGWQEGVKLIGKGGKIKLYIPPHLAYQNGILGGEALIFDLELYDVVTPGVQEEDVATGIL